MRVALLQEHLGEWFVVGVLPSKMVWPSFARARAFVDQIERKQCLTPDTIASVPHIVRR